MDLHEEFDSFARARASESGARLRGADARARLDARVVRGRRVQNAKVGAGTVAAVGVFAAGVVMVPRLGLGTASPGSSPSPTGGTALASTSIDEAVTPSPPGTASSAPAVDVSSLPALGTADYLVAANTLWNVSRPLACQALAGSEPEKGVGHDMRGQRVPLPSWIETGRVYGWGNDALVGGYPLPLAAATQSDTDAVRVLVSDFSAGPTELVLTAPGGAVWGFTVDWMEDALAPDALGAFVALFPNYDCNDGVPAEGQYEARMAFTAGDGSTQVVTLAPITVVSGVPSMLAVDAAGR
jgi:hypothetical protein